MNDLTADVSFVPSYVRKTRDISTRLGLDLVLAHGFVTQFMGHTTYQIEKFIINDREYPNNDAKYRQICRELWARTEAAIQNRHGYFKAGIEIDRMQGEKAMLAGAWSWTAGRRKVRDANIALLDLEIATREALRGQLQLDWEHRILRESDTLKSLLKGLTPPAVDTAEANDKEAWTMRARGNEKLAGLVR